MLTRLSPGQIVHDRPVFLPDGRHFLYHAAGAPDVSGVYIGQLNGAETRRLLEGKIDALPEVFRTVFVLRALEELTVEETAASLGIGFFISFLSSKGRALHDYVAGTVVIYADKRVR